MDIERLIALIVRTAIEELSRQGMFSEGLTGTPKREDTQAHVNLPPAKSARRVITAQMVLDAAKQGQTVLQTPAGAIVTPLARDTAQEKGVTITVSHGAV